MTYVHIFGVNIPVQKIAPAIAHGVPRTHNIMLAYRERRCAWLMQEFLR